MAPSRFLVQCGERLRGSCVNGFSRVCDSLVSVRSLRWAFLGGFACAGAVGSGWIASRWPSHFQADASFECRWIQCDGSPSAELPPSVGDKPIRDEVLAGMLEQSADACPGLTCEAAKRDLAVTESVTHAGTRRVVVRAGHADPSIAQAIALGVAREFVRQSVDGDPCRKAILELTCAENAFRNADRVWGMVLERTTPSTTHLDDSNLIQADGKSVDNGAMPTVPPMSPSAPREEQTLLEQTIRRCRQQRERIASTYTEQHPAVASLDRQIRQLEAELASACTPDQQPPSAENSNVQPVAADVAVPAALTNPTGLSDAQAGPSLEEARQARSTALAKLALAQQQFESSARAGLLVDYSDVACGPEPVRYVGANRARCFAVGLFATLAMVVLAEIVLGWTGVFRRNAQPALALVPGRHSSEKA